MADGPALALALVALAAALAVAVLRPDGGRFRWLGSEWVAAGAGALLLLAVGAIGACRAGDAIRALGPTAGFLAALLVLAEGCRREGLFDAVGARLAIGARGDSRRLLAGVFVVASAVTIVLGLDATVVLVTPIVLVCASRVRADPKPHAYACVHLANSASLLLPVSNLTNLLAFRASGLSFTRFALLMVAPTLAAVAVEWVALARWAPRGVAPRSEARTAAAGAGGAGPGGGAAGGVGFGGGAAGGVGFGGGPAEAAPALPRYALLVLALTLVGFALSSALSVAPVWIAVAGAVAITLGGFAGGRVTLIELVRSIQPGFLVFVLMLAVIVATAGRHGLTSAIRDVLPEGGSLGDLLITAAVAGLLANIVNNLPATLILVPVAAHLGAGPVLAVLIGVNVGPNLTEVGSLATLLWRRVLAAEGVELSLAEFVRLGALTVPPALAGATVALWLALKLV
ncbi:MAG: SLC13 family permease [Solirubrobacteraceae bacterium]